MKYIQTEELHSLKALNIPVIVFKKFQEKLSDSEYYLNGVINFSDNVGTELINHLVQDEKYIYKPVHGTQTETGIEFHSYARMFDKVELDNLLNELNNQYN